MDCEVLVIGAGPAGSSAALAAARGGADVIMIDRRRRVGAPAQCAGFVPAAAITPSQLPDGVIVQSIRRMVTVTPDGASAYCGSPGFMVRRDRLDQALAGEAARAGVHLITGMRGRSLHDDGSGTISLAAKSEGRDCLITARAVVGADGPRSLAGEFIGSRNPGMLAGAQWTVPLRHPADEIRIYFDRSLPGGYGWLFPLGGKAQAGVALARGVGVKPAGALEWFLDKLAAERLIEARRLTAAGGLIPVGGPIGASSGLLVLAGDAAGLCHPLTGAGIGLAMQSGAMAGEAAAASIRSGGRALAKYENELRDSIWPVLARALGARRRLYESQGGARSDFCRAIRQEWVGYPPG